MKKILAIGLLFPFLTGCAQIDPGERGVKVTMGVVDNRVMQPGFSFINPFMDHIQTYSIKQNTSEMGTEVPLTSDQQPITIQYQVLYKVPEDRILKLYQEYQGSPFTNLVVPQVREAFRAVVSQYKADQVVTGVNMIKSQVLVQVQQNVGGLVEVVDIPISHVELPAELQKSVMEKQKMEVESKKKFYELDKERKQAEITVTRAKAEAEAIRLQSEALRQSPELVKYKMVDVELEKAKRWNGKLPETVLSGSQNTIFSLK